MWKQVQVFKEIRTFFFSFSPHTRSGRCSKIINIYENSTDQQPKPHPKHERKNSCRTSKSSSTRYHIGDITRNSFLPSTARLTTCWCSLLFLLGHRNLFLIYACCFFFRELEKRKATMGKTEKTGTALAHIIYKKVEVNFDPLQCVMENWKLLKYFSSSACMCHRIDSLILARFVMIMRTHQNNIQLHQDGTNRTLTQKNRRRICGKCYWTFVGAALVLRAVEFFFPLRSIHILPAMKLRESVSAWLDKVVNGV